MIIKVFYIIMDILDLCDCEFTTMENNILTKNRDFLLDLFELLKKEYNNNELINYYERFSLSNQNKEIRKEILNIIFDIIKSLTITDKLNLIKLIWSCKGFREIINEVNIFSYMNEPLTFYNAENITLYVMAHNKIINDSTINKLFIEKLISNNIALTYANPLEYHLRPNKIEHCIIIFNMMINYVKNNSEKMIFMNGIKTFYLFFCESLYNTERDINNRINLNLDYNTILDMNTMIENIKLLMTSVDKTFINNKIGEYLFEFENDILDRILT